MPAVLPGFITTLASKILGESKGGVLRAGGYLVSTTTPSELPTLEALFDLWRARRLNDAQLNGYALLHGVTVFNRDPATPGWQKSLSGLWERVALNSRVGPGIPQLIDARRRGVLTTDQWRAGMERQGANVDTWERIFPTFSELPAVGDVLQATNRGLIEPANLDVWLRSLGYYSDAARAVLAGLRQQLPTPSDLITFLVREVFDPALASGLGLYDDLPESATKWFESQGIFGGPGFKIQPKDGERDARWIDLYWGAHWQPISPSQAYTMLHRLRPERIERYRAQGFDVQEFGIDRVREWLKVADYPARIRDYLAAIAYTPVRLVDIAAALRYEIRDRAWAVEQFKDRGLHPDDAEVSADLAARRAEEQRLAPIRALERGAVAGAARSALESYGVGIYSREQATASLVGMGMHPDAAGLAVDAAGQKRDLGFVKAVIRAVRRDYLAGILTEGEAENELQQAGVTQESAELYVQKWALEFDRPHRAATSATILRWMRRGLISPDEGKQRLDNLGWPDPDVTAQLAEAQGQAAQDQARYLAAQDRARKAQARELERLAAKQEAQARRIRGELRHLTPPARLQRWFVEGIVGEDYLRKRLRAMAYPDEQVEQYVAEAVRKRRESGEAAQANGQAQEEAT